MACFSAVQLKMFAASHSDRVSCYRDPQRGGSLSFFSVPPDLHHFWDPVLGAWLDVGVELACTWEGAQGFLCKVLFSFPYSFEKY